MVAVQSAFCLEMHQNEVFLFFKITIDTSTSKRFENIKKKNWKRGLHRIPKHNLLF
jgi:hypothetical protein